MAVACLVWFVLCTPSEDVYFPLSDLSRKWLFAFVVVIGVGEKLSGVANMLAMERDWVTTLCDPANGTEQYSLTVLNSSMRGIDLTCKLTAPLVISGITKGSSMRIGILIVGTLSLTYFGIEIFSAKYVWRTNPRLREQKIQKVVDSGTQQLKWAADTLKLPKSRLSWLGAFIVSIRIFGLIS